MTMSIPAVNADVASGASTVIEAIKNAAVWCGHHIKIGFNKLVEFIKLCWNKTLPFLKDTAFPFIKHAAEETWHYLRTPLVMAAGSLIAAITLTGIAEAVNNKRWVAVSLRIAGIFCAIGCGAALVAGAKYGFLTTII